MHIGIFFSLLIDGVHGGIDGYSCLIVYLRCSDNNQADNVLQLFTEAVMKYSCPSGVCADRGRENTLVADYMICQRGPNGSSFICGRSVSTIKELSVFGVTCL